MINLNSKINIIILIYIAKLNFITSYINVKTQKIVGFHFKILKIGLVKFEIRIFLKKSIFLKKKF